MSHLRDRKLLFVFLICAGSIIGCNDNPFAAGGSVWTQGRGVSNVNHFYASGGNLLASTYCAPCSEAYIFLSTDEGVTWKLDTTFHVYNHYVMCSDSICVTNGQYLSAPITFMSDGRYLFAGISDCLRGAIYASSDNGITWSNEGMSWPENDSDHAEDINCFCVLDGNMFAGTYHGVFVSTDEGSTWHADNAGLPIIYTGHPPTITDIVVVGGNLFASSGGPGIYRSTNAGVTWTQVDSIGGSFHCLATIGSEVFASAFNDEGKTLTGGVFVSRDSGKSWQRADADLPDHGIGSICASGSSLFVGAETAIFYSADLGTTWAKISNAVPFSGATSTVWSDETYLFTNSGGGVWRFPLFLLPGTFNAKEGYVLQKSKGE